MPYGLTRDLATAQSPDRDVGAETLTRDKLECPTQGELFRVLGRRLTLNQDASTLLFDDEMPDATMSCLTNVLLDLLYESYHKVTLHKGRPGGRYPLIVS